MQSERSQNSVKMQQNAVKTQPKLSQNTVTAWSAYRLKSFQSCWLFCSFSFFVPTLVFHSYVCNFGTILFHLFCNLWNFSLTLKNVKRIFLVLVFCTNKKFSLLHKYFYFSKCLPSARYFFFIALLRIDHPKFLLHFCWCVLSLLWLALVYPLELMMCVLWCLFMMANNVQLQVSGAFSHKKRRVVRASGVKTPLERTCLSTVSCLQSLCFLVRSLQ